MKRILLALAIAALMVGNAAAAIKYWDVNGTTAGAGGPIATGTWDTSNSNWTTDSAGASATTQWVANDDAVFSAGGDATGTSIVSLTGTQSVRSITIEEGNVTQQTGTVDFTTNNGVFNITDGSTWINSGTSGIIRGSAGLTMGLPSSTGTGVLRIGSSSPNLTNAAGPIVTINSGVVEFTAEGGLGALPGTVTPNALVINNGGTLRYARATNAVGAISLNRGVTLGGGNAIVDVAISGTATVGGSPFLIESKITAPAGTTLTKTGTGELRMSPLAGVVAQDFQKLVVNGGVIGIGTATSIGVDTLFGLQPVSPLADAVTMETGTSLRLLGGGGVGGDTIQFHPNRGFTLNGSGGAGVTFNAETAGAHVAGPISGTANITKTGSFTLALSNNNNSYGNTIVSGGTLQVNNTSGSGTGSGAVLMASGTTLSGTGIVGGAADIPSGARVAAGIGNANSDLEISSLTTAFGSFIDCLVGATGNDKLIVPSWTANGGFLSVTGSAAGGIPAGQTYTLVDYGGSIFYENLTINNATGYDATITNDTTNSLIKIEISNTAHDKVWTNAAGGNWSIADTGNWTSAGQPNGPSAKAKFTDPSVAAPLTVTLQDSSKTVGTLILDKDLSGGVDNPVYTIAPAASTSHRIVFNTYSGDAALTVENGSHSITAGLTFTAPTVINVKGSNRLSTAAVANTGGITKTGPGTWRITAANGTGAGPININEGTLQFQNNSTGLGDLSIVTIAATGTMDMNATPTVPVNDTFGALAGAGPIINGGNVTLNGVNTTPVEYSGNYSGTAASRTFTKNGAGTQILSGSNNFITGAINAGTLLANNLSGSALGTTGVTTVAATATLGGTGRLGGRVSVSATGILAPGSGGIGTLTLDGTVPSASMLTMAAATSRLNMELNTGLQSDRIALVNGASGDIGFNSTAINFTDLSGGTLSAGDYTLFSADVANAYTGITIVDNVITAGLTIGTGLTAYPGVTLRSSGNDIILRLIAAELLGDYNNNGRVDAADFVVWRENENQSVNLPNDGNAGAVLVGQTQYNLWRSNFGNATPASAASALLPSTVPEPGSLMLLLIGLVAIGATRRC